MVNRTLNYAAFAILGLLWLAFAAALLLNPALLDQAWQLFRGWPLLLQALVGLMALPLVVGLWVWQAGWPLLLRLVVIAGLAWVTIYTFNPRRNPVPRGPEVIKP